MADNTKIKKLIEDSFIAPEEKRALSQYIELKGVDMKLFDTFNRYLANATRNRGRKYDETVRKINDLQAELDKRITSEKAKIEDRLETELGSLDPSDDRNKNRIWKEYYETLDELGERYGRGLKDILSKILTA